MNAQLFYVDLLLPMSHKEPLWDAYLFVVNDRIAEFGKQSELPLSLKSHSPKKLTDSVILPGFINSHVHLSYDNNYSSICDGQQIDWIEDLVERSRKFSPEKKLQVAKENIQSCIKAGTTFVVENTPFDETVEALNYSEINSLVGIEVFGNDPLKSDENFEYFLAKLERLQSLHPKLSFTLSPHSPYNVSDRLLQRIIDFSQKEGKKALIHLAETDFESDIIKTGEVPEGLKSFYKNLGVSEPSINSQKGMSSVEYMHSIGCLSHNLHATHLVKIRERDLALLSLVGTSVSLCLRSNAFLANGFPPLAKMLEKELPVSFATDGLSSNYDLSLLEEIKYAWFIAKSHGVNLKAEYLFESITSVPAKMFCLDRGAIENNRKADFICYKIPQSLLKSLKTPKVCIYQFLLSNLSDEKLNEVWIDGKKIFPRVSSTF
ncbi:MAG: amidohydrolase family protein [Candidatus Caenarcaniphilales bacterium]|nr:amidohydrolase family protein [Candidatus Caenarcaniphilales bacterium]